ncbi:MAG: acetyl-CoA carboxylase biotin carboxyl carrier protein [candidate division FCPU426 bacterium]
MAEKGGGDVAGERTTKKERETSPLNLKSLKKIITIMNRAKITELDIEQDGVKIHLRKGPGPGEIAAAPMMPMVPAVAPMPAAPAPAAAPAPVAAAPAAAPETEDANLHPIASPMVGTFYRAPAPDAKPYVEIGAEVDENQVVCIVEAMKLMNEIKADVKGVIRKILVENAQAVEYGQPLFLVERKG